MLQTHCWERRILMSPMGWIFGTVLGMPLWDYCGLRMETPVDVFAVLSRSDRTTFVDSVW
jgi:hypothetical protein